MSLFDDAMAYRFQTIRYPIDLLKRGYLTGSRSFGTAKEDSDWDLIIPPWSVGPVEQALEENSISCEESNYFKGKTFMMKSGAKVNTIPLHPSAFKPWVLATRAMIMTYLVTDNTDPIKKYALFESLVASYKAILPVLSTEEYHKQIDKLCAAQSSHALAPSFFKALEVVKPRKLDWDIM